MYGMNIVLFRCCAPERDIYMESLIDVGCFHEKVPKPAPVTPPGPEACHSECGQISFVVVNISLCDRSRTDANPCAPRLRWLFVVFVCETICATIVILALEANVPPPWEVRSSRFLLGVFFFIWMFVCTLIADFTTLKIFFNPFWL